MYSIQEKEWWDIFPGVVSSYSEMQWREETVYLIIHLPFQQSKKRRDNLSEINKIVKELSRIKIRTRETGLFFLKLKKKRTLN
jgi:calcineurin-like phosphoesterase family protein